MRVRDLGTHGGGTGGPGRGASGRQGLLGLNCLSLGKPLVGHGGHITDLRQCSCMSLTCGESHPNDDSRGAKLKFLREKVELCREVAVDLEGSEAVTVTFPDSVAAAVLGLSDDSAANFNISHTFEASENCFSPCSSCYEFASFTMSPPYCPAARRESLA